VTGPSSGPARAVAWAGAAAYFAAVLVWMGGRPAGRAQLFPPGSAFSTAETGLSLARRYLAAREGREGGPARVGVLERPLGALGPEADAVVLRVRPEGGAAALLTSAERGWIEGGGRLVLALSSGYGPLQVAPAPGHGLPEKVFPAFSGVRRLEPPVPRALAEGAPLDAHAVFTLGARPVLMRWPLGRGDVVLLSAPEAIENGALSRADHLRLLEALAGSGRPVYFDEHAHGIESRPGVLDLLTAWGLGPALVLMALAAVVLLWRERARLGPAEDDHRERRSEAVDLLESLALLYDRALTPAQALRLYRRGLERIVTVQTGLKGEALARRVSDLSGGEGDSLAALNQAYRRTLHGSG
jgi:hypothetical protein